MPSFTKQDIEQIEGLLRLGRHKLQRRDFWDDVIAKNLVWPPDENGNIEVTEYGRKVLRFYYATRDGLIKRFQSQCSGCSNPC